MHSYGWWAVGTEQVLAPNVYARQLFSSKSSQHKDYTSLTKGSLKLMMFGVPCKCTN